MNPVQMASRFYDARDALRRVLTDYDRVVEPWRRLLRPAGDDFLSRAITLMQAAKAEGSGEAITVILAACADLADERKSAHLP